MNINIKGITSDSRHVKPGFMFLSLVGKQYNGNDFILEAISNGASVILTEQVYVNTASKISDITVPIIHTPNLKQILFLIADRFYLTPAKKLDIIGVTGTNGKSSIVHLITQILTLMNTSAVMMGTMGFGKIDSLVPLALTTVDPISLRSCLDQCIKSKVKYVAMEVSSVAICENRIKNIDFKQVIFTNLTRDHLDYHGDMTSYANAKARLFKDYNYEKAIINIDDPFGIKLASQIDNAKCIKISLNNNPAADYTFEVLQKIDNNLQLKMTYPDGTIEIELAQNSNWYLYNLLSAIVVVANLGFSINSIVNCLPNLTVVPGRMEQLGNKNSPKVIIDYAHCPDALEKLLESVIEIEHAKIICLFGAGGERDTGKRSIMARIAERFADLIFVTDDNPRNESPKNIFADIKSGFSSLDKVKFIHDREEAIKLAIETATCDDIVVVAGKGHETYQIIGNSKYPFDERSIIDSAIKVYNKIN